jgi:hypothetical protein
MLVTTIHGVQQVTATSTRFTSGDGKIKSVVRLSIHHDGEVVEVELFVDRDVSTLDILEVLS